MNLPKIKIDREHTLPCQMERVRDESAEFRACYTVGDLLREFSEQTDKNPIAGNIVYCNIDAFPGGTYYGNETHYHIAIMIDGTIAIEKIDFYTDNKLVIRHETIEHYKNTKY